MSRTRTKELKNLREEADALLKSQRDILEQAGAVVREASRQAGKLTREEVVPKVRDTYQSKVHPALDKGLTLTRNAAHMITDEVLPSVGDAVSSAVAAVEATARPQARKAVANAAKAAERTKKAVASSGAGKKATELAVKTGAVRPRSGPGKYILIGLGVVAIAGLAYAAWQTLRADDDLWIDDEVDQADVETPSEPTTPGESASPGQSATPEV